jgi:hypothetical protein
MLKLLIILLFTSFALPCLSQNKFYEVKEQTKGKKGKFETWKIEII